LLSFLVIFNLLQIANLKFFSNPGSVRGKPVLSDFSEDQQFVGANVAKRVFGKSIEENGPFSSPKGDNCPITAGSSLSLPCHALLNEASAKIGVDQASFRPLNRFAQALVRDPFAPRKPRKPFRLEGPHISTVTL
jgi:hypothetical protein